MHSSIHLPPHYVVKSPDNRYLFCPLAGRTVDAPWPCAWNTCVQQEAIDIAERMNAAQSETLAPWQVVPLDVDAIVAASADLAGSYIGLAEAA